MKSRAEYKQLFASPTMLYRALYTISTQRFRLPVRRYILDLFNVELNSETAAAMEKCAEALQAKSPSQPTTKEANRISIFGRLGRHDSESDDEEDDLDIRGKVGTMVEGQPVINLRPVSKIIGFSL